MLGLLPHPWRLLPAQAYKKCVLCTIEHIRYFLDKCHKSAKDCGVSASAEIPIQWRYFKIQKTCFWDTLIQQVFSVCMIRIKILTANYSGWPEKYIGNQKPLFLNLLVECRGPRNFHCGADQWFCIQNQSIHFWGYLILQILFHSTSWFFKSDLTETSIDYSMGLPILYWVSFLRRCSHGVIAMYDQQ